MIIKYSNQTTPITWAQIIKYHKNPPTITLPRQHNVIKAYQNHIDELDKDKIDINDLIYKQLFSKNNKKYCMQLNKYPYWCSGLIHYVIWFNPNYNNLIPQDLNKIDPEYVDKIIKTKFNYNDYVYYENVASNKSILGVKHLHVYIKTIAETHV